MFRVSNFNEKYIKTKLKRKGDAKSGQDFLNALELMVRRDRTRTKIDLSNKDLHEALKEIALNGQRLLDALNMFSINDGIQGKEREPIVMGNDEDLELTDPISLQISLRLSSALSELKIRKFKKTLDNDLEVEQINTLLEDHSDDLCVEIGYPADMIMPLRQLVAAASFAANKTKLGIGNSALRDEEYLRKWIYALQFTTAYSMSFKKLPSLTRHGIEDILFGALIENLGMEVGENESFIRLLTLARRVVEREQWNFPEVIDATDAPFL
ncbi:MAG: hypothetical protein IPH08_11225 [Rhodocyclaceae bacterium]|nr:hypothetical protein [Rhodocyclaceae bacterium]